MKATRREPAYPVEVEVNAGYGDPIMVIVGQVDSVTLVGI